MQADRLGEALARLRPPATHPPAFPSSGPRSPVRHDLSASECAPLTLAALLDMADDEDRRRWESLSLGYTEPRAQAARAKAVLSGHLSTPGEVLAHVALCAEPGIVRRNRATGLARLTRLREVLALRPELFELPAAGNLAFACPRYHGVDGAAAFAARLGREHGVLVMHSALWASALGPVPADRLRIGLGGADVAQGLDVLADALTR